jgi:hypothetical protein
VRSEDIHIAKRRVTQARYGTAIVHKFPYLVPASAHDLEPLPRSLMIESAGG